MVSVELGQRKFLTCNMCRLELAPYALSIQFPNEYATFICAVLISEQIHSWCQCSSLTEQDFRTPLGICILPSRLMVVLVMIVLVIVITVGRMFSVPLVVSGIRTQAIRQFGLLGTTAAQMQPDRSVNWQTCTQDGSREFNGAPEEDRRGIICECPSQPAFGDRPKTRIRRYEVLTSLVVVMLGQALTNVYVHQSACDTEGDDTSLISLDKWIYAIQTLTWLPKKTWPRRRFFVEAAAAA